MGGYICRYVHVHVQHGMKKSRHGMLCITDALPKVYVACCAKTKTNCRWEKTTRQSNDREKCRRAVMIAFESPSMLGAS